MTSAFVDEWRVVRLGSLLSRTARRNRPDLPLLSVVRERGVVLRNVSSKEENHNFIPDDLSNYRVVRSGDLVINKMKAWSGSLGVAPCAGIVSPAYFVFDLAIESGRFAHYLLRSRPLVNEFARCSGGVRVGQWDLSLASMKAIEVHVPDGDTQRSIVRYLDHAEMRIAKAIAGKNDVLVKLREAKTAVVGDLILGESGGDDELVTTDLGPIPADWQRLSLRGLLRPRAERNRPDLPLLSVVRSKGVVVRSLDKADNHNFIPDDLTNYKVVRRGNLAINKMKAWSGSAGVAEISGIVSPAYFVYQFIVDVDSAYMNLLFRSPQMRDQFARASRGVRVGQWDLSPDVIKSVVVGVPPRAEQQAIASKINERTAAIDSAMEAVENEIALLKEYRVRLISDVVTGKLDVRKEAASLRDVDPSELAAVLAGGATGTDEEEGDDGDE